MARPAPQHDVVRSELGAPILQLDDVVGDDPDSWPEVWQCIVVPRILATTTTLVEDVIHECSPLVRKVERVGFLDRWLDAPKIERRNLASDELQASARR